jgi:hypothetical protein
MSKSDRQPPPESPGEGEEARGKRGVSRRAFLTEELGRSGMNVARQLPGLGSLLGIALRETPGQRDERMVRSLWQLMVGRAPKPEESRASMDLVRAGRAPDEKGDALVDVVWALCRTQEFEAQPPADELLVRGFYRLALGRAPDEAEQGRALELLAEAKDPEQRAVALETMFNALIHSWDSVLRKTPSP